MSGLRRLSNSGKLIEFLLRKTLCTDVSHVVDERAGHGKPWLVAKSGRVCHGSIVTAFAVQRQTNCF